MSFNKNLDAFCELVNQTAYTTMRENNWYHTLKQTFTELLPDLTDKTIKGSEARDSLRQNLAEKLDQLGPKDSKIRDGLADLITHITQSNPDTVPLFYPALEQMAREEWYFGDPTAFHSREAMSTLTEALYFSTEFFESYKPKALNLLNDLVQNPKDPKATAKAQRFSIFILKDIGADKELIEEAFDHLLNGFKKTMIERDRSNNSFKKKIIAGHIETMVENFALMMPPHDSDQAIGWNETQTNRLIETCRIFTAKDPDLREQIYDHLMHKGVIHADLLTYYAAQITSDRVESVAGGLQAFKNCVIAFNKTTAKAKDIRHFDQLQEEIEQNWEEWLTVDRLFIEAGIKITKTPHVALAGYLHTAQKDVDQALMKALDRQ